MKRIWVVIAFVLMLIISGCGEKEKNQVNKKDLADAVVKQTRDEVADAVVKQTKDEVTEGDFIFRLVSEKEVYRVGERVQLYGEIEYTGEQAFVRITHGNSAVIFPIVEKLRNYEIGNIIRDIAMSTDLEKGVPYRQKYNKSSSSRPFDAPSDHIAFVDDFLNREDFPIGHYSVAAYTDFSVRLSDDESETINLNAVVDFKVME